MGKTRKLPSELRFKKLVEHMNEGVWMGDKNERTIYANPKFCQMTGYTLEEMIGKVSYDFWDEESAKRVRNINTGERKKGKKKKKIFFQRLFNMPLMQSLLLIPKVISNLGIKVRK